MIHRLIFTAVVIALLGLALPAIAADIYLRFQVTEPPTGKLKVAIGGYRHADPWYLPSQSVEAEAGKWSAWVDLTKLPLHGKLDRSGGVAEWPSLTLAVSLADGTSIQGCVFRAQLADKPDDKSVVIDFTEKSGSNTICFLLPNPLRMNKKEFETGSQMVARQLEWARKATGGQAPKLKQFDIVSVISGYDPALMKQGLETLRTLGFNVLAVGMPPPWWEPIQQTRREMGIRTYTATWHLEADPDESLKKWKATDGAKIANELKDDKVRRWYEDLAHYVIVDEIQTMDLWQLDPVKLNGWFRDYMKDQDVTDESLGKPLDTVEYPAKAMHEKSLPREADLTTRKIMYYAGKFGQYWTAKQLKQTGDLVKESLNSLPRKMKTETLPSDHGFFNAWGPPWCGMGYRGLDFFQVGAQQAIDILSAEDWMGLNHMYGPSYTWTGAMSFEFLSAVYRCSINDKMSLRSLITPSDDGYLRLKAYGGLAQGSKSLYLWAFGPTYLGTENYWSDLRSEYDGIAKTTRALEKCEDVLFPAKPVRDPVAILYSVSHDLWHTDDPAGFVETRLTWTALRHLSVQPDFLSEEQVASGGLKGYKVLYVTGECVTRKASAAIDEWVKSGGTVYLSAGAAIRDEFYEPYIPPFAATVWPSDASSKLIKETGHAYNERVDLPTIKPMATVTVITPPQPSPKEGGSSGPIKAIGYRLNPKEDGAILARFDDGKSAAVQTTYGKGTVYGVGFLPGLAYSPFKVGQMTLDEKWPVAPRSLIALPVASLQRAVQTSQPIVEASLLTGPNGSALVLSNHTYKPIDKLRVELPSIQSVGTVTSTEGVKVSVKRLAKGIRLELPLKWTDIVVLRRSKK